MGRRSPFPSSLSIPELSRMGMHPLSPLPPQVPRSPCPPLTSRQQTVFRPLRSGQYRCAEYDIPFFFTRFSSLVQFFGLTVVPLQSQVSARSPPLPFTFPFPPENIPCALNLYERLVEILSLGGIFPGTFPSPDPWKKKRLDDFVPPCTQPA